MFNVFKRCYDALDDKSGIDFEDLQFDGFDANSEPEYLRIARQLTLENPAGRAYDRHMPRLPWYQGLLGRWKDSRDKLKLSREDLIRISAPTHHG